MAARPPPNDSSDPDHLEFGIAALAARLDDAEIEYPATADEIVAAIDATAVPVDGSGNTVELSKAFDRLAQSRFENETEVLDVLHPVFETYRAEAGSGVIGRLRSLLPF